MFEMPALTNAKGLLRDVRTYGLKEDHLFELQQISPVEPAYGSWFVDNYVVRDGSAFVLTQMDPTFLMLAILEASVEKNGERFMELRQILDDVGFSWTDILKCKGTSTSLSSLSSSRIVDSC